MKTEIIVILSILLLIGLFVGGFYAFFMYSLNNMHKKQTIAENVQVTSEWLEINPEKPLETTKRVQKIMLSIKGYEKSIGEVDDLKKIELSNGTEINPEIKLTDENGKVYQLKASSRHSIAEDGVLIGFSLDREKHETHSFPKNVTYKTLRIRSDKPFQCKMIYWYDYDLK